MSALAKETAIASDPELHLYGRAMIGKNHHVSELHHEKYASSAGPVYIFRSSGIGQVIMVEAFALISNSKCDGLAPRVKRSAYSHCL